jgi:hypothetical protein
MEWGSFNMYNIKPKWILEILQSKVTDLYFDFDRLSTSGQETLDSIAKLLDVPTEEGMNDTPLEQHKERLLND